MRDAGVGGLIDLDYARIAKKLVGPREWVETRYYIGQLKQGNSAQSQQLYADQRRFLSKLQADDRRISVHFGRMETRPANNVLADELSEYLGGLKIRIERTVFQDLQRLARKHQTLRVHTEKAVDVMLAVDLVLMAQQDHLDAAYILSCDGDYTPAVIAAGACGKSVYAASCGTGAQLAAAVNAFIRLDRDWFKDCYRS
jgi:uncharacterized LabA/DUF88 family protein